MGDQIFKNILITIDGSQNSMKAAKKGIEIAKQNNAEVFILYVIDSNLIEDLYRIQQKSQLEIKTQLIEKAKIYVKDIQNLCKEKNLKYTEIIKEGNAVNIILKDSRKYNIDLIVMAHHSRTATEAIRLGSVCSGVLEFTSCPVLIIR